MQSLFCLLYLVFKTACLFEEKCDKGSCHRMGSDAPDKGQGIQGDRTGERRGLQSWCWQGQAGLSQPPGSTGLQVPEPGGARWDTLSMEKLEPWSQGKKLLPSAFSPHLSSGVLQSTGDRGVSRPNSTVASLTPSGLS